MGDWTDIGDGFDARRVGDIVEVRAQDPRAAERHDAQGRMLAMTRAQVTNVAACPPDWTNVEGTLESRYVGGHPDIRGTTVTDRVRHEAKQLCRLSQVAVVRLAMLAQ